MTEPLVLTPLGYEYIPTAKPWMRPVAGKFDPLGAALADRHYSRRTPGSPQFMPPGETLVLVVPDGSAVFGWWRPHPRSGIIAMNGLDGWTCTIFRREGGEVASLLILAAERALVAERGNCGPDGLLTYVWDAKVKSVNPGACFKHAGWTAEGRSADGRKTLLHKPWADAGRAAGRPAGETS